jgi:large subunit ribosomal protein L33
MAKKTASRELVTLVCTDCKEENYRTSKNKKNTTERLEIKKYCSRCKKSTNHKEKK